MRKRSVFSMIPAIIALVAVSSFAQTSVTWRTAADVRSGESGTMTGTIARIDASGFDLTADDDPSGPAARVAVTGSTRYTGLGVDASSSVVGDAGLQQLRAGDRVRVRGTAQAASVIRPTEVTLIGRSVATPATGVSDDRIFEGRIAEIRLLDQSFVLETEATGRVTVVATNETPVMFEGQTYSIRNLEVGDRVRVEMDTRLSSGEIRAARIEVLEDATPDEGVGGIRSENYVTGRVVRVDTRANRFTLRADRLGEIRVDAGRAVDRAGQAFRVASLQAGDRLRVWGRYTAPTVFRAERIEYGTAEDVYADDEFRDRGQEEFRGYATVVFYGTVERNPANEDRLTIRDRDRDRRIEIVVDEEFVVQREGTLIRAGQLRPGDRVVIKAFRGPEGDYIAQTIRLQ